MAGTGYALPNGLVRAKQGKPHNSHAGPHAGPTALDCAFPIGIGSGIVEAPIDQSARMRNKTDKPKDLLDWLGVRALPDFAKARWIGAGAGFVLLLMFLLAFVAAGLVMVHTIGQAMNAEAEGPNLGAGALIAALLGAPFLIWTTVLKHQTVRYQKEGHMTDRINKAVEQLGAEKTVKVPGKDADGKDITIEESKPNIEVRIGAILSLERIAQDSTNHDNGRDHVRVMEILCAYVRENSRALSLEPKADSVPFKTPRLDLQTAMMVIKRRSKDQLAIEAAGHYRLDLRSVDFDGMDLSRGDLSAAILWNSRFEGTQFEDTNLSGARFDGSLINFVWWRRANLTGASLLRCILNKPTPVAGGMVYGSPVMGAAIGVSVIGADLTAMDFFRDDPKAFFGSKDTKLHFNQDVTRLEANSKAQKLRTAKFRNDKDEIANLESEIKSNPFKDWAPYDSSDGMTPELLFEWRKELGLSGWPYSG
jgi:uncharacterized protein YjbI with pentapeptide repeats